jgi:hypothetical protein
MTQVVWDQTGERLYETGVDHAVLYLPNNLGVYDTGYAWNGMTAVTESPTGAESNPIYADNIKYLDLQSVEEFGGTIEALMYPDEWGVCDGTAEPVPGVKVSQQTRRTFGLSYRTILGNDVAKNDYGYKLHLVWGALVAPSEKAYATVNDSPETVTFSWEFTTTPVPVGEIESVTYKPTAMMTIDSTKVDAGTLEALEELLYGTVSTDPSLPLPADVIAMFAGTVTEVTPVAPTYNSTTDEITIPSVTGVVYKIAGEVVTGTVDITASTGVNAVRASTLYRFPPEAQTYWYFTFV